MLFFFQQQTAYELRISDWSSDVCSSDLQHLVETRVLLRLGVEPFFLAAQVVAPVAWPAGHLAAVDLDDARGQRAQEAAVKGDEHERAGPDLEEALEPGDRGDVEGVGRLVEQQPDRPRHTHARQPPAPLHGPRQAREGANPPRV